MALPVWSTNKNTWSGQGRILWVSGQLTQDASRLIPSCGGSSRRRWLESFWPSQLSAALEAACNPQSPSISSVITISPFLAIPLGCRTLQTWMWLIGGKLWIKLWNHTASWHWSGSKLPSCQRSEILDRSSTLHKKHPHAFLSSDFFPLTYVPGRRWLLLLPFYTQRTESQWL